MRVAVLHLGLEARGSLGGGNTLVPRAIATMGSEQRDGLLGETNLGGPRSRGKRLVSTQRRRLSTGRVLRRTGCLVKRSSRGAISGRMRRAELRSRREAVGHGLEMLRAFFGLFYTMLALSSRRQFCCQARITFHACNGLNVSPDPH